MKKIIGLIAGIAALVFGLNYTESFGFFENINEETKIEAQEEINKTSTITIPSDNGEIYSVINNNIPVFLEEDKMKSSFENYSPLDRLGRVGIAYAKIGIDLMPTEDRESIGSVKPTGWETIKYDHISGKYLYNRAHLIGFQLTGENANELNLMTGTRSFNVEGMLPFENMVADYIKETNNHVLYRVTPVFAGDNLLAKGVQIEALSIEDNGNGISFNVFIYNIENGIEINYETGESNLI